MERGKPKTDAPQKAETKLAVRNGSEQPAKKDKAVKDPYKTKRPPSAFLLFMKGFKKAYKEKHPNNKSVTVVCKAGGDKWRTMSEEDKAPFVAKANRLKTEYANKLASFNKSQPEPIDDKELPDVDADLSSPPSVAPTLEERICRLEERMSRLEEIVISGFKQQKEQHLEMMRLLQDQHWEMLRK